MFTDVQGSTAAWERHSSAFGEALQQHDRILRTAIETQGGFVVKTAGDAFMAAFPTAIAAVKCAIEIQEQLAQANESGTWSGVGGIRVRIGIHTGEPTFRGNDYFGPDVNRTARISDAAHGGMILVSQATHTEVIGSLPADVIVKDHNFHRLKDLGSQERITELRTNAFKSLWCDAPLRTLESLQHNFPDKITSLIGRRQERDDLNALLSQPQSRLITLTGLGGTGKTRLAIQIAADRVQDFKDGVWLAELAAINDPRAVPAAIAVALRIEIPVSSDPKTALLNYLRQKRALLVLDNFEQVADSAPLISEILRECPSLKCLVTSRELLHLTGEIEYPVEPLSIPPTGAPTADWASFDSVQLFLDRCQAARPDFNVPAGSESTIVEICRRLDGIPLAIELAAARVRGVSPAQILQRLTRRFDLLASTLRDVPERQRTLRGTIDWSYDLLTEDERSFFVELAVFSNGFFIEAAESVCTTEGGFDLVFSLRDKSLLKTDEMLGETRYYMLETIREYAVQKLQASSETTQLRNQHSEYYLRRAEEWSEKLATAGDESDEALAIFRIDLENMRTGMDWVAQTNQPERTVEYGKALFPYFRRQGLYEECDTRLTLAEEAARLLVDEPAVARLLNQRGLLAMERSDLVAARNLLGESFEISDRLGEKPRIIVALINLGTVHWLSSDFTAAREQWELALKLAIEIKQPRYEAYIRENLGILAAQAGRYEEAERYYDQSMDMHRKNGNQDGVASTLYNSSEVLLKRRQFSDALNRVKESNEMYTALDHQRGMALTFVRMGLIHEKEENRVEAASCANEGVRLAQLTGNRHAEMYGKQVLGGVELQEGRFEAAQAYYREALNSARQLADRKQETDTLKRFAELLVKQGDLHDATRLFHYVKVRYEAMGIVEAAEVEGELQDLAKELGTEIVSSLQEGSDTMDPDSILYPLTH